jgi:hypothetical protein
MRTSGSAAATVVVGLYRVGAVFADQHEGGHGGLLRLRGIEGWVDLAGDRVCGGDPCQPRGAVNR